MADAQASGACGRKIVWVQVPSPAFFFLSFFQECLCILLRISAILPEAISDGGLTPTTDTDLLLATYRGGSHLTSDIHQSTENPDNKKLLQGRTAHDKSLPPLEFHLFPSLGCLYYFFHFFYRISCISRYLFNRLARF